MRKPDEVFEAYLTRLDYVSGGDGDANWTPDGKALWFAEGTPDHTSIQRIDLEQWGTTPLLDVATLRAALREATGFEPPFQGLPFDSFTSAKEGCVDFSYQGKRWRWNPATRKVRHLGGVDSFSGALSWTPDEEPQPRMWRRYDYLSIFMDVPEQLSPDGECFAGVREHNIVLRFTGARNGADRQLTFEGGPECFWDLESVRFQLLSGRRVTFRGVSPWSPDSQMLLAYRRDITGVSRVPRVNWLKPLEDVEYLAYPKVGGRLDRVQPVLVDVHSGRQTPVQLGEIEDRFIQLLAWHPDSSEAFLIVYTRDFKHVEIVAARRETGEVRRVLQETAPTFVKVQHEAMFYGEHGFRLLPEGSGFLWLSTRDGWSHIYHYGIDGTLMGQLTRGGWPVQDVKHVGTDGFVYFTASIDTARPYDVHVCRVPLTGGRVEQLTHEHGLHSASFAPGGQAFIDTHSAVDRPTRADLVKADGTPVRVLSEMNISRLKAVGYTPPEEFTVKAADGVTDLWGVLYKPFDFDPARSYPVIEYIYGGPQTVETPRFFAIDKSMMSTMNLPWALAHLGYIVVCLDARGTPGRSKAFHDAIYGNFTVGIADHAAAIRQLCSRNGWMDANRVGITGHSWGGYFSTAALLLAPDTYHAAVSYAPSYGPWDAIYYEPYLDVPQKNPGFYRDADLIRQAAKLRGRLMIVAGTSDYFSIQTAMKMTWALIAAGIDHEFVPVPQAYHQFTGVEDDYLMMKLTGWFDRHVRQRRPS